MEEESQIKAYTRQFEIAFNHGKYLLSHKSMPADQSLIMSCDISTVLELRYLFDDILRATADQPSLRRNEWKT